MSETEDNLGAFLVYLDESSITLKIEVTNKVAPTKEQLLFLNLISDAENIVGEILKNETVHRLSYSKKLCELARIGLTGKNFDLESAKTGLEDYKKEFHNKFAKSVKNSTLKILGKFCSLFFISFGISIAVTVYFFPSNFELINILLMMLFSIPGIWVSYAIRKNFISFEELKIDDKDKLEPVIKIIFVLILTFILALILDLEILQITFSKISSSMIKTDFRVAILFGILCGIGEQLLPEKIYSYVETMFKK